MRIITIPVLLVCAILSSSAQTHTIHGRITAFNQFPLQHIEVMARKAGSMALTDSLGQFTLVCEERDVLKIRPEAFRSATIKVNVNVDTLHINLIFLDSDKNRMVATGFGYISENDLGFAMNHLEHRNNDFCSYHDIFDLLSNRFPGVLVEGQSISIRGEPGGPIMVVDGVPGSIGWISPCDIRSIDIIKDGMAAMYGSRGANGAIIIETIHGIQ